jgi:hypothetical protein
VLGSGLCALRACAGGPRSIRWRGRRSTWTLRSSRRKSAKSLYCKHFKAYQPLNTWWAEQGLIVHSVFRDGKVPAGTSNCAFFDEAARVVPAGVTKLYLRSDTAGYKKDLLKYCAEDLLGRFLNGRWRRECPAFLTPAEVAWAAHCAGRWNRKFAAPPEAAQAQRVENLILAREAAHRQFPATTVPLHRWAIHTEVLCCKLD